MPSQKDRVPILAEVEDRNTLQESNSTIVSLEGVKLAICLELGQVTILAWQLCICGTKGSKSIYGCFSVAAHVYAMILPKLSV